MKLVQLPLLFVLFALGLSTPWLALMIAQLLGLL
jgi:hypothetical protein